MDRTEIEKLAVCPAEGRGVMVGYARAIRDVDARQREDRVAIEALSDRIDELARENVELKARLAQSEPAGRSRQGDKVRA